MTRYTDSVLRWLDILDVPYIEVDGWRTRGSASFEPRGSVNHHTAGARRGNVPSLGTCINGRPDVPGPLCQGLLGRDHVLRYIASGRANHAGRGGVRGMSGNSSCFGLEVEHVGIEDREPIDWQQVDVAARIHAAWALAAGYEADMVVQHWEWTTRKIDFVKGGLDPAWFRREVNRYMVAARRGQVPKEGFVMDDEARAAFAALHERLNTVQAEAAAAGMRAQANEEKLDRIEFALGSKHEEMTTEGTALVRMLRWMKRHEGVGR